MYNFLFLVLVNPFWDKSSGPCVLDPGRIFFILQAQTVLLTGYKILLTGLFLYSELHYDSLIILIWFSS